MSNTQKAVCKCGHAGRSKQPEFYQCGYCYYSCWARSNREKADKLVQRAEALRVEAAGYEEKAEAFKAKHSDVCSEGPGEHRKKSGAPLWP